jgi:hypothetical protein
MPALTRKGGFIASGECVRKRYPNAARAGQCRHFPPGKVPFFPPNGPRYDRETFLFSPHGCPTSQMNTVQSIPWGGFAEECMIHVLFMGVFYLVVFAAVCIVLAALAVWQRGTFLRRAVHFGLFAILLLTAGALFNGLWSCMVWGRLYFSRDYVLDFSPLWPVSQSVIDAPFGNMRGQLLGVSLFQLQLVWLFFAAGTWSAAILSYRICRRLPARRVLRCSR